MGNYRSFYSKKVCDVGNGFVIHHMDHNRKNNNIENLVMLPSKLHHRYHYYKNVLAEKEKTFKMLGSCYCNYIDDYSNDINKLSEILKECSYWIDYKENCLLNKKIEK